MSDLIRRARLLMAFMCEAEAAEMLINDSEAPEDVFLAVKAALVIDHMEA